ncbi:methylenetetrahydrofolate reductase [Carboxydocella sp. JDF658]|uniref:methylenetetrahydrofolate reductase n=1 Tax=Carboxydocella sp. JDF658 TaxID=1926600 RepID=UPI0009AC3A5F|nr:methylenetetrahydrofolate reductase [Carboxydocella sp. JDF658]GAW32629.1 5,10-methylenetetrahydrofolate reductase [Carboxydocella sp. JDF658]
MLQQKLAQGRQVLTVELPPPRGIAFQEVLELALAIKEKVTAYNITDNQRAVMRMSPVAMAALLLQAGLEPICQFTCRDRNRLALQSEILGAAALGVRNFLLLTGDHTLVGDCPGAKPVFDLDSVQLLAAADNLRRGFALNGEPLQGVPDLFLGAVVNPAPELREMQIWKLQKKIRAGAAFVQTQAIYDPGILADFLQEAGELGVPILAGVIPLRSARMAHFMNANIPGIQVPPAMIRALEKATDPLAEGLAITVELIRELRTLVPGIHIMPVNTLRALPTLLARLEGEKHEG